MINVPLSDEAIQHGLSQIMRFNPFTSRYRTARIELFNSRHDAKRKKARRKMSQRSKRRNR